LDFSGGKLMIKRIAILFFFFILSIVKPTIVFSFGNAHNYIADQALMFFKYSCPSAANEFEAYKPYIEKYSVRADYEKYTDDLCIDPPKNPGVWGWCNDISTARDHFWNPDTNTGYADELGTFWTAYAKAYDYWEKAKNKYRSGDVYEKSQAYELLGAVTHLLSDMASVAHVQVDSHIDNVFNTKCLDGEDSFEKYYRYLGKLYGLGLYRCRKPEFYSRSKNAFAWIILQPGTNHTIFSK
jgi:hypothetical protein